MTIVIAIETIFFMMGNLNLVMISDYGPLIVLGLLVACLVYSTVVVVVELKDKFSKLCS